MGTMQATGVTIVMGKSRITVTTARSMGMVWELLPALTDLTHPTEAFERLCVTFILGMMRPSRRMRIVVSIRLRPTTVKGFHPCTSGGLIGHEAPASEFQPNSLAGASCLDVA
ncbi:MAG: hypothetical protein CMJ78_07825 [Planctomycetaceae bacterium]|nr:hypothetical protein [Planctomycetaceae bacterium]